MTTFVPGRLTDITGTILDPHIVDPHIVDPHIVDPHLIRGRNILSLQRLLPGFINYPDLLINLFKDFTLQDVLKNVCNILKHKLSYKIIIILLSVEIAFPSKVEEIRLYFLQTCPVGTLDSSMITSMYYKVTNAFKVYNTIHNIYTDLYKKYEKDIRREDTKIQILLLAGKVGEINLIQYIIPTIKKDPDIVLKLVASEGNNITKLFVKNYLKNINKIRNKTINNLYHPGKGTVNSMGPMARKTMEEAFDILNEYKYSKK